MGIHKGFVQRISEEQYDQKCAAGEPAWREMDEYDWLIRDSGRYWRLNLEWGARWSELSKSQQTTDK
jgi:hypothetical protein